MSTIEIDGKEYGVAELSDAARKLAIEMQFVTTQIREMNNMVAILTKAKRAYIQELKSEMLSAKTGFDFGSD